MNPEICDILESIAQETSLPLEVVDRAVARVAMRQQSATPLETTLRLYYQLMTARRFPRDDVHPLVMLFWEETKA